MEKLIRVNQTTKKTKRMEKIKCTQNKQKGRKVSLNKASMKKIKRKPVYKVGETKEIGNLTEPGHLSEFV